MKVMLVDDDSGFLKQAKAFLEDEDSRLEIETVTSAKQGLNLLEEEKYDAIVADYQMPEMDGLEFLKTIREVRNSEIPFIFFTGKGREDVAMRALNLGANRYIRKEGDPKNRYGVLADAIVQEIKQPETVKNGLESIQEDYPEIKDDLEDVKEKIEDFAQIKPVIEEVPDNPDEFWGTIAFQKNLDKFEARLDGFEKRLDDIQTEKGLNLKEIGIKATIYGTIISMIIAIVGLILRAGKII